MIAAFEIFDGLEKWAVAKAPRRIVVNRNLN